MTSKIKLYEKQQQHYQHHTRVWLSSIIGHSELFDVQKTSDNSHYDHHHDHHCYDERLYNLGLITVDNIPHNVVFESYNREWQPLRSEKNWISWSQQQKHNFLSHRFVEWPKRNKTALLYSDDPASFLNDQYSNTNVTPITTERFNNGTEVVKVFMKTNQDVDAGAELSWTYMKDSPETFLNIINKHECFSIHWNRNNQGKKKVVDLKLFTNIVKLTYKYGCEFRVHQGLQRWLWKQYCNLFRVYPELYVYDVFHASRQRNIFDRGVADSDENDYKDSVSIRRLLVLLGFEWLGDLTCRVTYAREKQWYEVLSSNEKLTEIQLINKIRNYERTHILPLIENAIHEQEEIINQPAAKDRDPRVHRCITQIIKQIQN